MSSSLILTRLSTSFLHDKQRENKTDLRIDKFFELGFEAEEIGSKPSKNIESLHRACSRQCKHGEQ